MRFKTGELQALLYNFGRSLWLSAEMDFQEQFSLYGRREQLGGYRGHSGRRWWFWLK